MSVFAGYENTWDGRDPQRLENKNTVRRINATKVNKTHRRRNPFFDRSPQTLATVLTAKTTRALADKQNVMHSRSN